MNNTEVANIIDVLANKLGTTASQLIELYTPWIISSAWCWIFVGAILSICLITISLLLYYKSRESDKAWYSLIAVFGLFLCSLFMASNIPDIVAPEASAVHKIIHSLK